MQAIIANCFSVCVYLTFILLVPLFSIIVYVGMLYAQPSLVSRPNFLASDAHLTGVD